MKILLTGATGFLGTALWVALNKENHQIFVVKRSGTDLCSIGKRPGYVDTCGTTKPELISLFERYPDIDVIVHAATDYGRNEKMPTATFWGNVAFPVGLLETAMQNGKRLFINIDTFFNTPNADYQYLGSYALSKRHFQEWGRLCGAQRKLRFVNLRLFHLYGPGDSADKFVPSIVKRCAANEDIDLTDGEQRRDFIYIDDAVDAVIKVIEAESGLPDGYMHYDVGTGESWRIRDFVEEIRRLSNSSAKLNFGALPKRVGEFENACADSQTLKETGWQPRTSVAEGVLTLINEEIRQRINLLAH